MKIRLAEDLEIKRYGMDITEEEIALMNKIRDYDVRDGMMLSEFLQFAGIKIELFDLVRDDVDTDGMELKFYDLVYVNFEIKSNERAEIDEVVLKENDFVFISRSNGGSIVSDKYQWVKYFVRDRAGKQYSSKRIAGLKIGEMLGMEKCIPVVPGQEININGGKKNISDNLDWGDQIDVTYIHFPKTKIKLIKMTDLINT